jgi:DNA modification methylase
MPTYLHLTNTSRRPLPPEFQNDDVRYPESLVEHFLMEFTREGDTVLDPFAGFGTTLLVAESLGRVGYGIEVNGRKAGYVQGLLRHPERLIHGDARRLAEYDLPPIDLCLTSPPYTTRTDDDNPFTDYSEKGQGYAAYLQEIRNIFAQVARLMKPSAHVVIEVANLKDEAGVTPLAWDVAAEVSRILHFEGETVICWDRYGYGYDHSYCLAFSKTGESLHG